MYMYAYSLTCCTDNIQCPCLKDVHLHVILYFAPLFKTCNFALSCDLYKLQVCDSLLCPLTMGVVYAACVMVMLLVC